ncbi:MAG: hypothetical protein GW911_07495 [Armatimonadetes bacterium]|nr:hypothetical protein [Armatimonadota bacterium]NCO90374.1 hypothetical protein [Armatimonadota bacterium]NCP30113.1 hypothetical protein [Armatimonadota bacterium]NCQ31333.1 hypothetical protein [Armatimonadota bacterium]NDK11881.1 hypothetical protein [Armatimonadota bacterium]
MSVATLLIGLGKGGSALMPYLLSNEDFDLVAVCDSSEEAGGGALARMSQLPYLLPGRCRGTYRDPAATGHRCQRRPVAPRHAL